MDNSKSPVRKKIQNSYTAAFLCQPAEKVLSVWKYPCLKKILLFPHSLKHSSTIHAHAKMSKGVQQQKGEKKRNSFAILIGSPCFPWTAYDPLYLPYLHAPSCSVHCLFLQAREVSQLAAFVAGCQIFQSFQLQADLPNTSKWGRGGKRVES